MVTFYLAHSTYTTEFWRELIAHPEDRSRALEAAAGDVDCKFHGLWHSMDRATGYVLFEGDDANIVALYATLAATDSVSELHFHRLVTVEEMMEALPKAAEANAWKRPGQ